MPIYEYLCPNCKMRFELRCAYVESKRSGKCPKCHSESQRIISPFACKTGGYIRGISKPFTQDSSIEEYKQPQPQSLKKLRRLDKNDWAEVDLVRYSATSAAAGVLLVVIPPFSPIVPGLGIFLFLFSFLFLIPSVVHYFNKWNKLFLQISQIGDGLSIGFMLFSILSVFINWSRIMALVYNTGAVNNTIAINWVHDWYAIAIIIWLFAFFGVFVATSVRMLKIVGNRFGILWIFTKILPVWGFVLGFWGAFILPFTSGIEEFPKVLLITIYSAFVILLFIYVSRRKDQITWI